MATMLSAIFTDLSISKICLNKAVRKATSVSFNAITIDGDTSTNDSFIVLANGQSEVKITDPDSLDYQEFENHLVKFAQALSQLIVRDGEGATKFVEVHVKGAMTEADAKQIASSIATSPLVKTAIYGKDANWGRIVCAIGYSGVKIIPEKVGLFLGSPEYDHTMHLFKNGMPNEVDEKVAAKILECGDLLITVDLGEGSKDFKMYTCDFSHEYISINADYRS